MILGIPAEGIFGVPCQNLLTYFSEPLPVNKFGQSVAFKFVELCGRPSSMRGQLLPFERYQHRVGVSHMHSSTIRMTSEGISST